MSYTSPEVRVSMAMIPWHAAGSIDSVLRYLNVSLSFCTSRHPELPSMIPSRSSPAAASMMASYSPTSSFCMRVPTFPLRFLHTAFGYMSLIWYCRLRLLVPTTKLSFLSNDLPLLYIKTSCGHALGSVPDIVRPSMISIGISLALCTAMSMSPLSIASSNSSTNTALPPNSRSALLVSRSPRVLIVTI